MEKEWSSFITLPQEEVLITTRRHWFTLLAPISLLFIISSFFIASAYMGLIEYLSLPFLFFAVALLLFTASVSLLAKTMTDWYFHLYVITTRKILEMSYTPLFSYTNNHVLLDQVRCTEIDVRMGGIINELFDMGSIAITFDRPTHQEEFVIENIPDPKTMGQFLDDILVRQNRKDEPMLWFKQKEGPKWRNLTDDIFPKPQIGV